MRRRVCPSFSASPSTVFLTVLAAATLLASAPLVASELQGDDDVRVRPVNLIGDPDSPFELQSDGQGFRAWRIRDDVTPRRTPRIPDPFVFSSAAQEAAGWRNLGLYGGPIACVAVSPTQPNVVLAGLESESPSSYFLYRSLDGGATWTLVPILGGSVRDIEFAPDGNAYVAADWGLYRVRNVAGATSWAQIGPPSQDFSLPYINEVALNPNDANDIWIGRVYNSSVSSTVLHSRDGGLTWVEVGPYNEDTCSGIAMDPANTDVVVACFGGWLGGGRAWRTLDGGVNWSPGGGLPSRPMTDVVHDGTRFLLCGGQEFLGQNLGIYQSTSNGESWTQMSRLSWPSRVVRDLEIDGNTILAATTRGLFRSDDRGATWSFGVGGTSSISLNSVRFVPGDPNRIVLGAEGYGVLVSNDGGAQFTPSSTGIRALNVTSVAVNPNDPREIAATYQGLNSGGVFTTPDGGNTWNLEPLPPTRFDALEYSATGTLYVASTGPSTSGAEGVYRRNADGTWATLGPHLGQLYEADVSDIRVSRNDPNLIVICGSDWSTDLPTIWRSTNGGLGWTRVFAGVNRTYELNWVSEIKIIEDGTDQRMLAIHTSPGAVAVSTDRGATWVAQQVLPEYVRGSGLAASNVEPNTLYLANYFGRCYKTHDAGASWIPLVSPDAFHTFECDLVDPNVVYGLGNYYARASRTTDGGATFGAFDTGLDVGGHELAWGTGPCPALLLATPAGVYARDIDSTPPDISVVLDPNVLWPPNHKLRTIRATVSVTDNCDANATFVLTSIVIEDERSGDCHEQDIVAALGTPCTRFKLRAERSGGGNGRRYLVTYTASDAAGNSRDVTAVVQVPHDMCDHNAIAVGSPDESAIPPLKTELVSVQPNPFNPSTTVVFSTSRPQFVTVDIVDVRGARVHRLVSREFPAGEHRASWDGRDSGGQPAASGVYFIRFVSEEKVQTMKAHLIK